MRGLYLEERPDCSVQAFTTEPGYMNTTLAYDTIRSGNASSARAQRGMLSIDPMW